MSDLLERAKEHLGSEWPTTTQNAKRGMIRELVARVEEKERECQFQSDEADKYQKRAEQAEASKLAAVQFSNQHEGIAAEAIKRAEQAEAELGAWKRALLEATGHTQLTHVLACIKELRRIADMKVAR